MSFPFVSELRPSSLLLFYNYSEIDYDKYTVWLALGKLLVVKRREIRKQVILATVRFTITNFSRFSGILGTARYVITNILGFLAPRHLQSWIFWDYRRREIHNRVPESAIRYSGNPLPYFLHWPAMIIIYFQ